MALTRTHATPVPYLKSNSPVDTNRLELHIHDELRKIEATLKRVNTLIPQAADTEPSEKLIGLQRYAVAATWDPLGTGVDAWVYWNGTAWVAL